jgi:hypothetical protein
LLVHESALQFVCFCPTPCWTRHTTTQTNRKVLQLQPSHVCFREEKHLGPVQITGMLCGALWAIRLQCPKYMQIFPGSNHPPKTRGSPHSCLEAEVRVTRLCMTISWGPRCSFLCEFHMQAVCIICNCAAQHTQQ